jgi:hypothetical protein
MSASETEAVGVALVAVFLAGDAAEAAADFLLLVEPLLSDEVLLVDADAAEVSVAGAFVVLDFVDFLVVVVAD